jgi:hypothetical protein
MSKRCAAIVAALSVATGLATAIASQQPRILNGRLNALPAGSLQQTFKTAVSAQTEIAWIGYSVPVADRNWGSCCWSSADGTTYMSGSFRDGNTPCCGNCRIEPASGPTTTTRQTPTPATTPAGPVKLEGAERMVVMFRVADRKVERIRSYSEDCELDAGGRSVTWLQDVRPAESVALLESLIGVNVDKGNRVAKGALSAMAMHAEPSATEVLIRVARSHQDAGVRSEALFWVGQKAGRRAAGTITEAIEKDPETEVKKRAVFALSQLPPSEGVPLLIDIARKNPNPVVRKQAIFWLGQSKDPRALEFFAEILK